MGCGGGRGSPGGCCGRFESVGGAAVAAVVACGGAVSGLRLSALLLLTDEDAGEGAADSFFPFFLLESAASRS